jgi:hypothetical protein
MMEHDKFYWPFIVLIGFIAMTLLNASCKNISKIPQVKYNLSEVSKKDYEIFNYNDTVVFLKLGSGYLRGSEHNYYSVKKKNGKTIVDRISNFQKFKTIEISSSNFPWKYIIENFDKFTLDTIKTEEKIVTEDGRTIHGKAASHGPTTFMKVKLGETEHQIYLAPLVDSFNDGNINLDLIEKTKNSIILLDFIPSERIKYKRER